MNRPEFLIRTLRYYAKMRSPHPIYLTDSSNPENSKIITSCIEELKSQVTAIYNWVPPGIDYTNRIFPQVKEAYVCQSGDDDYLIPDTMTKCAEFLEKNPEYASAGGYAVTFRLVQKGPYGEIKRLADYPRYSVESETASQRLIDLMRNYFTITFSVNRTDHMREIWKQETTLISSMNELFPASCCAIAGKSKLMDRLGVVRHIHDQQYQLVDMVDWLTAKGFHDSYISFRDRLAKRIMEKDNIGQPEAELAVKNSFWEYLETYLTSELRGRRGKENKPKRQSMLRALRSQMGKSFPILKTLYRRHIKPLVSDKKEMHYEVIRPDSPYYKDFQNVVDSFSGKDINKGV